MLHILQCNTDAPIDVINWGIPSDFFSQLYHLGHCINTTGLDSEVNFSDTVQIFLMWDMNVMIEHICVSKELNYAFWSVLLTLISFW